MNRTPAMSAGAPTTLADRILARAGRPGGCSRHEIVSHMVDRKDCREAGAVLEELVKSGAILRFTRPAKGGGSGQPAKQYFTHAEDGDRWVAEVVRMPKAPKAPSDYVAQPFVINYKRSKAVSLKPAAEPVVPAGVKVTVLPSAPVYARHQLPPGAVVPRVISSDECRPWAAGIA
jgi:hypothetical protein